MPLLPGKKNIGHNIETEIAAGKPRPQAEAIALRKAGVPRRAKSRKLVRHGAASVLLMIAASLLGPALVRDMGYCADVGSPMCAVRAFWPRVAGEPSGHDAYWFENDARQVCFTDRARYITASLGSTRGTEACIWRDRHDVE